MNLTFPMRGWICLRWLDSEVTPAFADAVNAIIELPGASLREKVIEIPRSMWTSPEFKALLATTEHSYLNVRGETRELWAGSRTLYAHQDVGARFLVRGQGGLLGDEMGLGKTLTAIVAAETLTAEFKPKAPKLIVAPGYTRDVWRRELLACGAITSDIDFAACAGRSPKYADFNWDASWWFCHFDVAAAWAPFIAHNRCGRPLVAVVDEVHWIKNGRAQRSKGVAIAAGVAPFRIGLTGTPMPNRTAELWHVLTVLDGTRTWGSPIDFRRRYCGALRGSYGWVDHGPTHSTELKNRLEHRYLRREIEDAGVDLPKRTRTVVDVALTDAQQKRHDKLVTKLGGLEELTRAIRSGSFGQDTLPMMTKLRQLTSQAKIATTTAYVESLVEQDEDVVVFCWERKTVETIAAKVMKSSTATGWVDRVMFVHGGLSQDERDLVVADFQLYGGVLVATIDSLKEGVTLHKARCIVMHDMTWVPSDFLQAEARVHRIGQTRPVISSWVLVKDSFDTLLASALLMKGAEIATSLGITAAADAADEVGFAALAGPTLDETIERMWELWDA